MLSLSLYTVLKLSKTTSPNKLLHNDCVTLYLSFSFLDWKLGLPYNICAWLYFSRELNGNLLVEGENNLVSINLKLHTQSHETATITVQWRPAASCFVFDFHTASQFTADDDDSRQTQSDRRDFSFLLCSIDYP